MFLEIFHISLFIRMGYVFLAVNVMSGWKILALVITLKFWDERRFTHVSMLPLAERVRTLCNARLQCLPYERENDLCFEYISHRNLTLNCNDKGGLELWVGVGFVTYGLGADISLPQCLPGGKVGSRKQWRVNCVQKRSHGPKSRDDSFGTTLQRHVWRYCNFLSCSNIPSVHAQMSWLSNTYHAKKGCWNFFILIFIFTSNWYFSRLYMHKRNCKNRACVSGLLETEVRDGFVQTGTPKMLQLL